METFGYYNKLHMETLEKKLVLTLYYTWRHADQFNDTNLLNCAEICSML